MRNIMVITAVALAGCSAASNEQTGAGTTQAVATPPEQSAAVADSAPAVDGLSDLAGVTFGCPKAALNAAAREATKVRAKGTYQFAYFKILNDSHHAMYEVHFRSNYEGDPDLKYCVAMYCQQGWDPRTTKTTVTMMGGADQSAAHGAQCGDMPAPAKRQ